MSTATTDQPATGSLACRRYDLHDHWPPFLLLPSSDILQSTTDISHGETAEQEKVAPRRCLVTRSFGKHKTSEEEQDEKGNRIRQLGKLETLPDFYDKLSKIHLIHKALEEFDRRTKTQRHRHLRPRFSFPVDEHVSGAVLYDDNPPCYFHAL